MLSFFLSFSLSIFSISPLLPSQTRSPTFTGTVAFRSGNASGILFKGIPLFAQRNDSYPRAKRTLPTRKTSKRGGGKGRRGGGRRGEEEEEEEEEKELVIRRERIHRQDGVVATRNPLSKFSTCGARETPRKVRVATMPEVRLLGESRSSK